MNRSRVFALTTYQEQRFYAALREWGENLRYLTDPIDHLLPATGADLALVIRTKEPA